MYKFRVKKKEVEPELSARVGLERLPPAYQLAPVVSFRLSHKSIIYIQYVSPKTLFFSQLNILRAREYLSPAREDNWPCITFEALSIREKLSLSSLFFAFAMPPGRYFWPGKNELRQPTKGNRKRDSEALQRKKRAAKTYAGCLSRIYVCCTYACVYVYIYIYLQYTHTHTYTYYVYVYMYMCVFVCTGGIYRFPLRAKRSTCFTLHRNAHYIQRVSNL